MGIIDITDYAQKLIKKTKANFGFGTSERIEFYELIAEMTELTSVKEALEMCYRDFSDDFKNPDNTLARLVKQVRDDNEQGIKLAASLRPYIPEYEFRIIMGGEDGGNLQGGFLKAAKLAGVLQRITMALRAMMLNSGYTAAILLGYLSLCAYEMVPNLLEGADASQITGFGLLFIYFCNLFRIFLIPISIFVIVAFGVVKYSLPRWTGKLRIYADEWPIYKTHRAKEGLAFLIAFTEITKTTVERSALLSIKTSASPWLRQRIDRVIHEMDEGYSFAISLKRSGYNFPSKEIIKKLVLYDKKKSQDLHDKHIDKWQEKMLRDFEVKIDLYAKLSQVVIAFLSGITFFAMSSILHQVQNIH